MNRREMLQTGLAVLSAAGVEGEIQAIAPVNPQMFVFRFPGRITTDAHRVLREEWERLTKGTAMEGIKAIVLENGASLEVVDAPVDAERVAAALKLVEGIPTHRIAGVRPVDDEPLDTPKGFRSKPYIDDAPEPQGKGM